MLERPLDGKTSHLKRWLRRVVGPVASLAVVGTLLASGGSFNLHGSTLTAGTDFTISSSVTAESDCSTPAKLAPGATRCFTLSVHNPKDVPITVTSITTELDPAYSVPSDCGAANLDLSNASFSGSLNVPAGGDAPTSGRTIALANTGGNQDGCKNVTFHFLYSGSATYAKVFDTSAALAVAPSPATLGQTVTLTATVSPVGTPPSGGPTGSVTFKDGTSTLTRVDVGTNGVAQWTTTTFAAGTHSLTAVYSNTPTTGTGDGNFNGSTSSPASLVVTSPKKTSTTTVSSSLNPAMLGQSVTLTASVASQATGTVTFYDNGTQLGVQQTLVKGAASITTSALAVGTHPITARYSGDGTFSPSTSSALNQVINPKAGTSTAVTSSANPSKFGQSVTFTATVSASSGKTVPTGSVTFTDGGATLGSATLNNKGVATFSSSTLGVSTSPHAIKATYSGDGSFAGSFGSVNQSVSRATSSVTLASSSNSPKAGQSITFTVTVTGPGAGPTGAVTLSIDGNVVRTWTIPTGGALTYSTSSLATGSHTLTATYAGDANYTNGSASLTQKVGK